MSLTTTDKLIWVFLIFLIVISYNFFKVMRSEGNLCLSNPLSYGALRVEEQAKSNVSCTCNIYSNRYAPFIFTKEGLRPVEISAKYIKYEPNFTLFFNKLKNETE